MTSADRLIVALDFPTLALALAMARRLRDIVRTVKVGSALFTAAGPTAVQRLRRMGFNVMLDLKFFDIPSTVELSCRAAAQQRVSMLTVHAAGEPAMLEAAVRGARAGAARLGAGRPLVLAVTVLTSVGHGQAKPLTRRVLQLARAARDAGCDGVVASAQEAAALRVRFGNRLRIVCPGIRPAWAPAASFGGVNRGGTGRPAQAGPEDQGRVCTPGEALARGADALVVGRPITAARNPRAAAQHVLDEMEAVETC